MLNRYPQNLIFQLFVSLLWLGLAFDFAYNHFAIKISIGSSILKGLPYVMKQSHHAALHNPCSPKQFYFPFLFKLTMEQSGTVHLNNSV